VVPAGFCINQSILLARSMHCVVTMQVGTVYLSPASSKLGSFDSCKAANNARSLAQPAVADEDKWDKLMPVKKEGNKIE
jgi:hypothetical protein